METIGNPYFNLNFITMTGGMPSGTCYTKLNIYLSYVRSFSLSLDGISTFAPPQTFVPLTFAPSPSDICLSRNLPPPPKKKNNG